MRRDMHVSEVTAKPGPCRHKHRDSELKLYVKAMLHLHATNNEKRCYEKR